MDMKLTIRILALALVVAAVFLLSSYSGAQAQEETMTVTTNDFESMDLFFSKAGWVRWELPAGAGEMDKGCRGGLKFFAVWSHPQLSRDPDPFCYNPETPISDDRAKVYCGFVGESIGREMEFIFRKSDKFTIVCGIPGKRA